MDRLSSVTLASSHVVLPGQMPRKQGNWHPPFPRRSALNNLFFSSGLTVLIIVGTCVNIRTLVEFKVATGMVLGVDEGVIVVVRTGTDLDGDGIKVAVRCGDIGASPLQAASPRQMLSMRQEYKYQNFDFFIPKDAFKIGEIIRIEEAKSSFTILVYIYPV